jgi:hypothetical protein
VSEQRRRVILLAAGAVGLLVLFLYSRRAKPGTGELAYVAPGAPALGGDGGDLEPPPEFHDPIDLQPGTCIYDPNTRQVVCAPSSQAPAAPAPAPVAPPPVAAAPPPPPPPPPPPLALPPGWRNWVPPPAVVYPRVPTGGDEHGGGPRRPENA